MLIGWRLSTEAATVVLQSGHSSDRRYVAEVVRQDPGVSSSYRYMVRVMPAGATLLEKSLDRLPLMPVYVAVDLHRSPDTLDVRWSGPREVTIHCAGCEGMVVGKPRWREIALKYEMN